VAWDALCAWRFGFESAHAFMGEGRRPPWRSHIQATLGAIQRFSDSVV
jgi:hypothetical protein